jgi:hypothetical protein
MDLSTHLAKSQDVATKIALLFQKRMKIAHENYGARIDRAYRQHGTQSERRRGDQPGNDPLKLADMWRGWFGYGMDAVQRSILFWDTLRQRGNNFIDHTRKGLPPVLNFEFDMVMDGRRFARPVNYALVAIKPPDGMEIDDKRRPYVIIDPRAGHGPGIGGFKDDSQVGVALAAGHPVYFVIFFREPEPGQSLLDVCAAEQRFVRAVRERHPDSPKPAIVGNCQGGWAAMMLAASDPEYSGPIVINGAPMS